MNCQKCGSQIPDQATFCRHCGAKQKIAYDPEPKNPVIKRESGRKSRKKTKRRQKSPMKAVVVTGITILALAGVTTCFFFFGSELLKRGNGNLNTTVITNYSRVNSVQGSVLMLPWTDDEVVEIFENPSDNDGAVSGNTNVSHSIYTVVVNGIMYIVKNGSAELIDKGVRETYISNYGESIAYADGYDSKGIATTNLYVLDKGQRRKISDCFTGNAVFSPNGQYLFFSEKEAGKFTLRCFDGKENMTLVNNKSGLMPIAIMNGAKGIWYAAAEESGSIALHYAEGKNNTRIGNITFDNDIMMNADCSEIAFSDNENSYVCRTGKALIKGYPLMPDNIAVRWIQRQEKWTFGDSDDDYKNFRFLDIDSFWSALLFNDDSIMRVGKHDETISLIENAKNIHVSSDQKTIVYQRETGEVIRARLNKAKQTEQIIFDRSAFGNKNASYIYVSADCEIVCIVTGEGTLYYQEGEKEPVQVYGNRSQTSYYEVAFSDVSKMLYYIDEGILYSSEEGEVGKKVSGIEGEPYRIFTNSRFGVVVYSHGDYSDYFYRSTDGKTFTLVSNSLKK